MTAKKPTRAKALGVSDEHYERLLAAQGGHCALCPATPKTRRLHTDHDHATGLVRGLLCHRCNRFLATWMSVEWLARASAYLRELPVSGLAGRERREILDEINGTVKDGAS